MYSMTRYQRMVEVLSMLSPLTGILWSTLQKNSVLLLTMLQSSSNFFSPEELSVQPSCLVIVSCHSLWLIWQGSLSRWNESASHYYSILSPTYAPACSNAPLKEHSNIRHLLCNDTTLRMSYGLKLTHLISEWHSSLPGSVQFPVSAWSFIFFPKRDYLPERCHHRGTSISSDK